MFGDDRRVNSDSKKNAVMALKIATAKSENFTATTNIKEKTM